MQKKLIVGLGFMTMTALAAGACSSSSSPAPTTPTDGGETDATMMMDGGMMMEDTGTSTMDAPAEAAEMMEAAAPTDAGDGGSSSGGDAGDGAVGDAE